MNKFSKAKQMILAFLKIHPNLKISNVLSIFLHTLCDFDTLLYLDFFFRNLKISTFSPNTYIYCVIKCIEHFNQIENDTIHFFWIIKYYTLKHSSAFSGAPTKFINFLL